MYADSHAHLSSPPLLECLEEVLERARETLTCIVNICTDSAGLEEGLRLHAKHPWVYNAAAVHPQETNEEGKNFFSALATAARNKQLIAIGETGLDYYRENISKASQHLSLISHLELANETHLPLLFHCREAFADLFSIVPIDASPVLIHCFTGTLEEAQRCLERGWFLSFSGVITFKKSDLLRKVVAYAPLDRILLETDAPFLAPQSKRGQQNEPSYIRETAEMVAIIKQIPLHDVATATVNNTLRFFNLMT